MLDPARIKLFYDFMTEREHIRLRRAAGLPREQWTNDPVFQTYSFTNVKRAHDRHTQIFQRMYRAMFAASDMDAVHNRVELMMTCAAFRYFGTEQSACALGRWAGAEDYSTKIRHYGFALPFTAAYIIPAAGKSGPKYDTVAAILEEISKRAFDAVQAMHGPGWELACDILTSAFGCGSFMAKEVLLDYVQAMDFEPVDWQTWTPVGPGGRRGASRVRDGVAEKIPEPEALDVCRELYAARQSHWTHQVQLDLTDIQFQLCEFDKWSRVAEGRRPKRYFQPTQDSLTVEASSRQGRSES